MTVFVTNIRVMIDAFVDGKIVQVNWLAWFRYVSFLVFFLMIEQWVSNFYFRLPMLTHKFSFCFSGLFSFNALLICFWRWWKYFNNGWKIHATVLWCELIIQFLLHCCCVCHEAIFIQKMFVLDKRRKNFSF